ncbi:hypothetical protein L540_03400 [Bordetella pseudohinzii]|uniref:Uncharacterized protein n=1 Tax=Bordetella pseudohinzii TaxID=1331258 RepID=A0ABN4RUJ2_9BORD|nr:hypothetical protein BBN53_15860 [Bordetella pseudohinzii]KMM24885.1 hypothetical protein L540_03400 [Bordetella pseudohinzii]
MHKWWRHPRLARAFRLVYAVSLVLCIFGGGVSVGSLTAWNSASRSLALQVETNTQQREDYRRALAAMSAAVSRAAGTAEMAAGKLDKAADAAEGAIKAAKGAATKAGTAATRASAAAKSANTAVKKVEEALAPPAPAVPARVPEWMNTP